MLNQDYSDMLSLLLENGVEFLVVGAYALAVHGYPRATADIDIFVKPSKNNAEKLYGVLIKFGAPVDSISLSDFEKPGTILQIGVKPRRIDIITDIDGMTFDEAAHDKAIVAIDDLQVPVISKRMLIANKLATGRDRDRLDVDALKKLP